MNAITRSYAAAELCRTVHKWRILHAHELSEAAALKAYAEQHDVPAAVVELAVANLASLAPDPTTPLLYAAEQLDRHANALEHSPLEFIPSEG